MKKLLIISDYFAPDNEIAAVRLTKIAKYLVLSGYIVDVLRRGNSGRKEDPLLKRDLIYFNKIYFNYNSGIFNFIYNKLFVIPVNNQKIISKRQKYKLLINKNNFFILLKNNILAILYELINYNYFKYFTSNLKIKFNEYSIVFSSYGPMSSHFIGDYIKKKSKNIFWIADFRDNVGNNSNIPLLIKYYRKYLEKRIVNKADMITIATSECCCRKSSKIHVIPNGYDIDDFVMPNYNGKNKKFIISYTGTMYNGMCDLLIFFKIISELIDDGIISYNEIEIKYLGRDSDIFLRQAKIFSIDKIIKNYGFVSRTESLNVQNNSNALILMAWNSFENKGVLTGKLYEYFMAKKPILCFISGNKINSELKKMIMESKSGFCFEEANFNNDYNIMKNYIKEIIFSWKKNKQIFYPDVEYIEKYNYKSIVNNILELI